MPGTALVTGASSGIGEQFARQLAARGHDLVLVARRADRLESLAAELPTEARVIACDLGSDAAALPARVAELGVEVDLLVNNAGFGTHDRFWEVPEGRDAEMVRVNCEAVVVLTRAFLPAMVERRAGGVIVVASTAGMQPLPYETVYAASKAFALNFTDALHAELRGTGVRCLAVNPGSGADRVAAGRRLGSDDQGAGNDLGRAGRARVARRLRPRRPLADPGGDVPLGDAGRRPRPASARPEGGRAALQA